MPENIKASIERLFHKIPAMKFPLICMSNFQSIYHFTVSTHCMHFLPGAPLTVGSVPLYLFNRQDLRKYISQLYFLQSTGRRGTFLSEEQICNCAVVPSYKANSVKVKLLLNQPEINIGANLQIFL